MDLQLSGTDEAGFCTISILVLHDTSWSVISSILQENNIQVNSC